jgi:carboxypeptidase E
MPQCLILYMHNFFPQAFEITLELGCEKMPAPEQLPQLWADNRLALLEFIRLAHMGIKGLVQDALTGQPVANAIVWVRNVSAGEGERAIKHPITTCESILYKF